VSTIVELINYPINLGGVYRIARWCVEFDSTKGDKLLSAWVHEFYVGQGHLSINLSQQGFDTPLNRCQGYRIRVALRVVGYSQRIYSEWVKSYQTGIQYKFSLLWSDAGPKVSNQTDMVPSSSLNCDMCLH
jgi:hypothetical protein